MQISRRNLENNRRLSYLSHSHAQNMQISRRNLENNRRLSYLSHTQALSLSSQFEIIKIVSDFQDFYVQLFL